jgi:hypothetical protein
MHSAAINNSLSPHALLSESRGRFENNVHAPALAIEDHLAIRQSEQGVVSSPADIPARMEVCAALPHDNAASADGLSTIHLDAQALAV